MTPRTVAQIAVPLLLPAATAVFLWSAPHAAWQLVGGFMVAVLAITLDIYAGPERRQPAGEAPGWLFDLALYVAVALQLLNVAALVRIGVVIGPSAELAFGAFITGLSSGYSAIVVAHELIHRPQKHFRQLGRLLLATVLYEHFFTEHIRGHHRRIGTDDDPATARFGESLGAFLSRTVTGQFRSAWRLETKRLGDVDMPLWDLRLRRSRVVHGLAVQGLAVAVVAAVSGWAALALVAQAGLAVLLLECVNYVEHWGLRRQAKRVSTVDSWDTESWFTYYTLVGLSRHADHHAHAARPYQDLRHFDESPKMPYGYWGMVVNAIFRNANLQRLLTDELRRTGLGPFQEAKPQG